MEFLTVHELSRQFNISARSVRYRLQRLIDTRKFKNGDDYRREDFSDAQHFTWKINPTSFMRESGLQRSTPPANLPTGSVNEFGDNPSTNGEPVVNKQDGNHNTTSIHNTDTVNKVENPVNHRSPSVNETVKKEPPVVNESANAEIYREMIDVLKNQISVKDTQIKELTEQVKGAAEMNIKLNGALLANGQKIENLLQLTGGKMAEAEDEGTETGNHSTAPTESSYDDSSGQLEAAA